eukprot:324893_1
MGEAINDMTGERQPEQSTKQINEIELESQRLELDVLCLSNLLTPIQLFSYQESTLKHTFPYTFSQLDIKPESDFSQPRTACTQDDFIVFSSECTTNALPGCDEEFRVEGNNVFNLMLCLAKACPLDYEKILYSECAACMMVYSEINNVPSTPMMGIGLAAW